MNTVYIELVFLDNFLLNFLIILFASVLTKSRKKLVRFACGAMIGGVYACVVFGSEGLAISLAVKAAVSLSMCFVAFGTKKRFWKNTCAFYITSFVLAGVIYALNISFGEAENGLLTPLIRSVFLGVCVCGVLITAISRVHKKTVETEQLTLKLTLLHGEQKRSIKAYYDTGNMLTEPLSGYGVIFVTKETASSLFDKDTLDLLQGKGSVQTDRLRILPCTTATGKSVLRGIKIDKVTANGAAANAVVCIANAQIADGCDAIVGNKIMSELKKGAQDENVIGTSDYCVGNDTAENRGKRRLHKRQRGTSAAAVKTRGSGFAHFTRGRRQLGAKSIDREKSTAGRVHCSKV